MIGHVIVYLIFAIILFVFNVINTSYVPFLLLVLFAIISFVSLVTVIILNFNTEVSFQDEKILAQIKEKQSVLLQIRNKSFIPLVRSKIIVQVQYGQDKKKRKFKIKAYCGANSTENCEFSIDCTNCEVVSMKIKKFYVYDFLNLFCLYRKPNSKSSILVLPKLLDDFLIQKIGYKINNDENIQFSDKKPGDDVTEIFAIRDYVSGDKIRNIHWKLSSKKDKLMVKEYSLPLLENDIIMLDVFEYTKTNKENRNEMFQLLYGLICEFLKRGWGIKVCYIKNGIHICEINNMQDVFQLMEQVYEIIPYKPETNVAKLYATNEYENNKRFFYVADYKDNNALASMRLLSDMGDVNYLIPGHTEKTVVPVKYEG